MNGLFPWEEDAAADAAPAEARGRQPDAGPARTAALDGAPAPETAAAEPHRSEADPETRAAEPHESGAAPHTAGAALGADRPAEVAPAGAAGPAQDAAGAGEHAPPAAAEDAARAAAEVAARGAAAEGGPGADTEPARRGGQPDFEPWSAAPDAEAEPRQDAAPATAGGDAAIEPWSAAPDTAAAPGNDAEPPAGTGEADLEPWSAGPGSAAAPASPPAGAAQRVDSAAEAETGAAARRPDTGQRPLVRKEYYSISEVSDLVGLPAHVLRYWESQFAVLSPSKNRSGNRVYQRKEIKLILLVKQLLHEDKYTVEGAKQKLDQLRRGGGIADAAVSALDAQMVTVLREELLALNELLQADPT
jgi:DNA-binding transcriptional MerR regulator